MSSDWVCVHIRKLLYEVIYRQDCWRVVTLAPDGDLASPKKSIYGVGSFALKPFHEAFDGLGIFYQGDNVDMISHYNKRDDL